MKQVSRLFLICSIGLFVMSLTQPAYSAGRSTAPGWLILLVGIFGPFTGGAGLSWLANPFLILSWLTFVEKKVTFLFSFLAVIASSSFLLFTQIMVDEGGGYGPITDRHLGYWLWLFSTIVMLAGNGIGLIDLYFHKPCKKPTDEEEFVFQTRY